MHTIPLAVSEQQVSPGTLGFIVVALLGLALFFLIRSMNKHIKKVNFDDGSEPARPEPPAKPGAEPAAEATAEAVAEPAAAAKPDDTRPAGG